MTEAVESLRNYCQESGVSPGRERNQTHLICLPFPNTLCDNGVKCYGEKFELSL